MRVEQIVKGRTVKTVVVEDIGDETNDQVLALAMRQAGESRSSLFGWDLHRNGATAVAKLYTD